MLRVVPRVTVAILIIDDHVADHIWERHRIDTDQVLSLPERRYVIVRNHGAAPYRLIGRDEQGRCIAAPIASTDDWLTWNVVSAWHCDKEEQNKRALEGVYNDDHAQRATIRAPTVD